MKISKILSSSVIAISFFGFSIGGMLYTNTHANADGNSSLNEPSGSNGNSTAGTNSLATLKLTNGYLALDNVPNLNFGGTNDTSQSNTLNLKSSGLLRVTDYRNKSNDNTTTNGPWELDVKMDPFKHDSDGNNTLTDKTWQMQLNNSQALNNSNGEGNSKINSEQNNIPVTQYSKFNDDNNDTQVMKADGKSNDGYGTNSINYNNNDANLIVPSVRPDSYYTTMHWTLSANMTSNSNDNGNDSYSSNNANKQAISDPNGSNNANSSSQH